MKGEHLSYEKFGAVAGVSAQAVQKWLNGGDVKEISVQKLSRHYKVAAAWIRYGVGVQPGTEEAPAAYAVGELSAIAVDVAAKWMTLSLDRQDAFRDMIFTTHWMEARFPAMRKGRPKGETYGQLELAIEKDFRQLRLKLE